MEYSERVVSVLSECVVKVVRQMLDEYTMQLNQKLKNIVITSENIKPLSIKGENIASGAINGVNIAQGTITNANIQDGSIDTAKINNLAATVAKILSADIDWANIEKLEAATADIVKATIEQAKIDWAEIKDLETIVQNTAYAVIKDAKIDFAQIYDLVADTAIITQGVAGKLYIQDLAVTAANIDELTLGKLLMVKDEATGEFYQITVDENHNVVAEVVQIVNGNIANGAITGGNIANGTIVGGNIADGTITGGNLNAGAVFGDQAIMVSLTANMGKFANLFANTLVAEQLKAHLIESDYLKIIVQDTVRFGGRNLIRDSNVDYSNSNIDIATYYFGNSPPRKGEEVTVRIKGTLEAEQTHFSIVNYPNVNVGYLNDNSDGTYSATFTWHTEYMSETGAINEVDNDRIIVRVLGETEPGAISMIDWIMFERGNQASDWSAAPEDMESDIDELVTQMNAVEQRILPERLVSTVTQSDEYRNGLAVIQQSAVTQAKGELEIRFTNAETMAQQAQSVADEVKTQLDTWYRFDDEALTIGKSDSKYKTRQDNEKYEFLHDGAVVAAISGSQMNIPRVNVRDEWRIGGMQALVDPTTGVIEWVWVGFDQEEAAIWRR